MTQRKSLHMSSISWDDFQMVALLAWLEENVSLVHGELVVVTADIPPEAFAAEVDLDDKLLRILANPDNPMADITTNVFLGYIIALAFDRGSWTKEVPSLEDLLDCHRLVCEAMTAFNPDFTEHLQNLKPILENWREAHCENAGISDEEARPTTAG